MFSNPFQRRAWWSWLLVFALTAALIAVAWMWRVHDARRDARLSESDQRVAALEQRLDALRRNQHSQYQRLQHADATNRVLRDELLAIGQRAALLENSVEQLANAGHGGVQALRLDEAELLLSFGLQRLQVAGDVEGARRAYALAGGLIDGAVDPGLLSLRQTLAQERAALESAAIEPRSAALAKLAALGDAINTVPAPVAREDSATQQPWWRRALARVVQVRRSDAAAIVPSGQRAAALAGLQLELTLARTAAERRDSTAFRVALQRAEDWLTRLWPDSPARRQRLDELRMLAATPLSPALPTLGSTLVQLRQLRAAR